MEALSKECVSGTTERAGAPLRRRWVCGKKRFRLLYRGGDSLRARSQRGS